MNLCDKKTVLAVLKRYGISASKSKGQNFLIADWVTRAIAEESGITKENGVLEIGPGIGALTAELAARAGRVAAVELDRTLIPLLREHLADFPNAAVIPGDILRTDLKSLVSEQFQGLRPVVCANLPYNITTPVLTALIDARLFADITVMVQREVARRICAAAGSPDYGAFSVYAQYHTAPEILFEVPPDCFYPVPKITSAVLRMTVRGRPAVSPRDEAFFFRTVRAAFALRRKTLLNALSAAFAGQIPKEQLKDLLLSCGLPEDIRGERLDLAAFSALSDALFARLQDE
jgi:16S rRNA (adenine1518-N6/adenine1519-N6)-dimethyltransferase